MYVDGAPPPRTVAGLFDVVGPRTGSGHRHTALVRRVLQWHGRIDDVPGGADDGLPAGTASGRATGLLSRSSPDTAAVVHSGTGRIHLVRVPGTGRPGWTGIRSLADVPVADGYPTGIGTDTVARLTQPFSGLFAPAITNGTDGDPVVARLSIIGAASPDTLGWAPDPGIAIERALLAGLRVLSTRLAPAVSGKPLVVGASGVSEVHWLLDGALHLLSAYAVTPPTHGTVDDVLDVVACHVPHLADEWRFARVFRTSSGAAVAAAWGRGVSDAIRHAVAAARAQLAVPEPGLDAPDPTADAMLYDLTVADLSRLRHDVRRCVDRLRLRPLGMRLAADAVLGDPGPAWGIVWQA